MTTQLPSINETIYRLANHIAGAKGGLPAEWQDWADEIETDLRTLLAAYEQEPVYQVLVGDSWVDVSKGAMDAQQRVGATVRTLYTHPSPSIPAVPENPSFAIMQSALDAFYAESDEVPENQMLVAYRVFRAAMLNVGKSERDKVRAAHAEWSQKTFGNVGPVGPLKHLAKEAIEAADASDDLSEWADMQFLLWDAQRRAGITDEQINLAMIEKLAVNKTRSWPAPKDGEPRLHIKSAEGGSQ